MHHANALQARRAAVFTGPMLLVFAFAAAGAAAQTFTQITDPTNPIVADAGPPSKYYGTAWVDYDNDGDLDLFVNQDFLYRNEGGDTFVKVTTSGLGSGQQDGGGAFDAAGTSWADVDNDGDLDAFLSGRLSHLYRNEGDGTFARIVTGDIGDGFGNRGWACAFVDYDSDGNVDLSITHPDGFVAGGSTPNHLLRNDGPPDYTFTKILSTPISDGLDSYTVGTWSDYDHDGDMDHFIGSGPANGTLQPDNLYRNELTETGTATFVRIMDAPIGTDLQDGQVWNWIDYDNDGDLDAYVTNWGGTIGGVINRLYQQEPDGSFVGVVGQSIVTDTDVSLASIWADFDNDGDQDCYTGNDGSGVDRYYRNEGGGVFTRIDSSPIAQVGDAHRSATAGDYDDDGDLDLFINGPTGTRRFYRNDTTNGNHWINLRLVGTASNRAAIGVKVRVRASIGGSDVWQLREVSAQNSFNGHNSLRAHFGLGDATAIDSIEVAWPSGMIEAATNVTVDQFLTLVEGSTVAVGGDASASGYRRHAYPNPFRARSVLRFSLKGREPGRVTVHDVSGRVVRLLATGRTAAGWHAVSWDGRDDRGNRLRPGVYFYRLETAGGEAGRVTLLR